MHPRIWDSGYSCKDYIARGGRTAWSQAIMPAWDMLRWGAGGTTTATGATTIRDRCNGGSAGTYTWMYLMRFAE
jgi:hypothetical protein